MTVFVQEKPGMILARPCRLEFGDGMTGCDLLAAWRWF
jgi:hypothetical protein